MPQLPPRSAGLKLNSDTVTETQGKLDMIDKAAADASKETPTETTVETLKEKTYSIVTKDKSYSARAQSLAWTENGLFILLMDGDVTRHVIVAANVVAVTEL